MNRRQRQRQRQEEERRWNPPQLVHRDNNRRGVLYPKSPMTIFFVFLFLLSVRMSVSNIRQAVELLPDSNTYDRYLTPLATFPISDRPNELPSSNISGSTKDSLSAQASNLSLPPLLSVIPNANNTAISLVSMGNLVGTFLVERCIRSIRRRGKFTGVIMVFTDSVGYKQYQETIPSWDDRTVIIQGREEDMHPREENSDRVVRLNQLVGKNHTEPQLKIYKQDTMVFKRFKTHHSKYIADNPALSDSIRYVMYLDIDNIIGSKLDTFFEGYTKMVIDQYQQATDSHRNATSAGRDGIVKLADESNASGDDGFGFVSMFRDKHLKSKLHSGIIVFDLAFEKRCVDAWRNEMDTFWDMSDQKMFLRVVGNYTRYQCTVFQLSQQYMSFSTAGLMTKAMHERQGKIKKKRQNNFHTFIHVTKYRVNKLNNKTIHNEFVRHLLQLKDKEMMTDSISWEDVVSPMAWRKNIGH